MDLDADMYDEGSSTTEKKIVDSSQPEVELSNIPRDNALHIKGVDDMSTANVHTYISIYTKDSKPRIEWIDDTSLNLVYYTAEDARVALTHLIANPPDSIDNTKIYSAHNNPEKPESQLTIRYATEGDKKERGAKDRSRWYLFHPEDDPDNRSRHGRAGRKSKRNEPYSRNGRHDKRMAKEVGGGADLFAGRLATRIESDAERPIIRSDLFEGKTIKKEHGADTFTSRISEAAKISRSIKREASDNRANLPSDDLFSRIERPRAELTLAERISGSGSSGSQDLFAGRARNNGTGTDLAGRIGGAVRTKDLSIRGAGRRSKASDMF